MHKAGKGRREGDGRRATAGGHIWAVVSFQWDSWEAFTKKGPSKDLRRYVGTHAALGEGENLPAPTQGRSWCGQDPPQGGPTWSGRGGWGWGRRTARSWGLVGHCKGFALTLTEMGLRRVCSGAETWSDLVLTPHSGCWEGGDGHGWDSA